MYNFEKELIKGEKIIYKGKSYVGKGGNKMPFLITMLIIFVSLFIYVNLFLFDLSREVVIKTLGINLILLLCIMIIVYMIIDKAIFKDRRVKNDSFCITNMRLIIHDYHRDNTIYGYLNKFNAIHTDYVKDNYGDIRLTYQEKGIGDKKSEIIETKYTYEESNPEKLLLVLEQIENVDEVVTILKEQIHNINNKKN